MKKLTSLLLAVLLLAMAIPSMAEEPVHLRIATWTSNEDQLKLLGSFVDEFAQAKGIAIEPEFIVCDEPISALDVSIQSQVVNMLEDMQQDLGLTYLFIAHDLSVVRHISNRIGVMYLGCLVELAESYELNRHPLHPYTKSLLSAIPLPDPHYEKQRKRIKYEPLAEHDYSVDKPSMREVAPGHFVHCNDAEFARYQAELKAK